MKIGYWKKLENLPFLKKKIKHLVLILEIKRDIIFNLLIHIESTLKKMGHNTTDIDIEASLPPMESIGGWYLLLFKKEDMNLFNLYSKLKKEYIDLKEELCEGTSHEIDPLRSFYPWK